MIIMYDSVDPRTIPFNPPATAGYVGGFWPDFAQEVALFPRAHHVSIAVNAFENAECLDVENGDAVPGQAPAWVGRQKARGVKRPIVYTSVSSMQEIWNLLAFAGFKREDVRLWTAHYTNVPHLCHPGCYPGFNLNADATQWTNHALGRNLDESDCLDSFFEHSPQPARNAPHLDWFDTRTRKLYGWRINERSVVAVYDKLRASQTKTKHPHRLRLWLLKRQLKTLANRVYQVAHDHPHNGKPSWAVEHRGWRYQQLIRRSQGQRFI